MQIGQAIQPGAEIATIIDPDPMLAVGAVRRTRARHVRVDQPATMRFIDGSDQDRDCQLCRR